MSEETKETRAQMPVQCLVDRQMLRDIHLAVCGNPDLGLKGLVSDVKDLKDWRRKLDLRVAGVAGAVSGVPWLFTILKNLAS